MILPQDIVYAFAKDKNGNFPDQYVPRFEIYFAKQAPLTAAPKASSSALLELEDAIKREKGRLDNSLYVATGDPSNPPPFVGQYLPLAGAWGEKNGQATNDVESVEFTESIDQKQPLAKVQIELHNVYDPVSRYFRYTDIPPAFTDVQDRLVAARERGVFPLLDYGDHIALRFGYGATLDWVFDGIITTLTASYPADGEPKLTVTAVDKRELLRNRKKLKPKRYSAKTEEEIAAKIAAEVGLRVAVTQAQIKPGTPPAKSKSQPSDQDSLQYLTDRANHAALELGCLGNTLFLLTPADKASSGLGYRYRAGLTSFTPTLNNAGKPSSVQVKGTNLQTHKAFSVTVKPEDLQKLGLAPPIADGDTAISNVSKKTGDKPEVVTNSSAANEEEAKAIAIGIMKRNMDMSITAAGDMIGDPRVRTRVTLVVDGVGRFSGSYYVTETTHKFGSNGYQTSFKARRTIALSTTPTAQPATGVATVGAQAL